MRWVKARFDLSPAVRLICFAALLALLGVVPSPARSAPSLNSYVAGSDMRSVSLAPDGRHAAVVRRFSKDSFLLNVIDISGESRVIFSLKDDPDMAIIGVRWVSNTRLVMTIFGRTKISGTDYPYTRMIAMDADGSNQQPLMTEERELRLNLFLSNILSTLPQDNAHILALGYDNGPAIYKVDVYSGAAEQVAKGNSQTIGWRFGDRGEAKLRIDYSKFSRVLKIYAPEGRRWKRILKIRTSDEEEDAIKNRAGLDDSGQVLLLDRKAGSDFIGLHVYDLNSRQLMRTIFEADGYDIDDTIEHPQTGEVIGVTYISDRPQQVYFDPKLQRVQAELERQFPNGIVSIIASSDNLRKHLFYTEAPWRPGSYYIYDAVAPGLLLLGHAVPDFGDRPYTAEVV